MWENFFNTEVALLQYINKLGSPTFDPFWLFITKTYNWIPFFLLLLFMAYKNFTKEEFYRIVVLTLVSLFATVFITAFTKYSVERSRPIYTYEIAHLFRKVTDVTGFSFFSGHTSNSFAVSTFLYLVFRKKMCAWWVYVWALPFAFSRLYLAVHFPTDILVGFLVGNFNALWVYFLLYKKKFTFNLLKQV